MAEVGSMGIQYVILENEFDYTEATFADLLGYDNVYYYRFPLNTSSSVLKRLYVLHGAQKANKLITLPGQGIWNHLLFDESLLDNSRPVCFIYSFRRLERIMRAHFLEYVSRRFPETYHVAYWDDLVRPNHLRSLRYAKEHFDLVFSYDEGDAERYGMRYYPSFYSKTVEDAGVKPEVDVFFVGNAKDRLEDIYAAYDALSEGGASCRFVINGVDERLRRSNDGVEYNKPLTYQQVLGGVLRARCILEIVQGGSRGQTLRVNEAVCYGRRLLSNNPAIRDLPQFDPRYMRVFDTHPSEGDAAFALSTGKAKYEYPIAQLSPTRFIEAIESLIGGEKG